VSKFVSSSVLFLIVIVLSGCFEERIQPLHNAVAVTIPQKLHSAPISEIEDAIIRAGTAVRWDMERINPGTLRAVFDNGKHRADVDIFYSTTAYSITYVSSTNLLYSRNGIHRSYNRWLRALESKIDEELFQINPNPNWRMSGDVAEAKSAWLAIENSDDPNQFSAFLEVYGDSEYAAKANSILQKLLAKETAGRYEDSLGTWNIVVDYIPSQSTYNLCAPGRQWNFNQNITRLPLAKEIWNGSIVLYFETINVDEKMYVNFVLPAGAGKWDWDKPLVLDGPVKTFTAEAKTGGGNYNNCLSKMIVKMTRKS
jgi:hypothetical protein